MERELPDSEQRECGGEGPRGNCRGRICTFFNNSKSVSPENRSFPWSYLMFHSIASQKLLKFPKR